MRKEHHRVSLTVPKINESERVGMKPGPVCSDSFWSHCVCAYSSSQTLGSSVHPEGHILHSTGKKNSVFPFTVLCTQISWSSFLETIWPSCPIPPKMSGKEYWYFSLHPDTWLIPGASVWWGSHWHFQRKHTRSMLQDESCQPEAQIAQQKKTLHIPKNPIHGVCKDPTLPKSSLPCQPGLTHVLHPWALTDQNSTDWMQKPFPPPLILPVWQALSVWWTLQLHPLKTYGPFANMIAQIHRLDMCCQH